MNKLLRALLRAGLYFLEESDQMRDRVGNIRSRTREAIGMAPDHAMRDAVCFIAGVGLGVGMGMLFAPASGRETRDLISEKVHDVGTRVRDRFSDEMQRAS